MEKIGKKFLKTVDLAMEFSYPIGDDYTYMEDHYLKKFNNIL